MTVLNRETGKVGVGEKKYKNACTSTSTAARTKVLQIGDQDMDPGY